jgi:hypothetical protein
LIIINQLNISIMKKLFMLLAVVAMSVSYSFAQNANSAVTVTLNQQQLGFFLVDCDGNLSLAPLVTSNKVVNQNGSAKYTATHNAQASCSQPAQPVTVAVPPFIAAFLGYDYMEVTRTPGGMIHTVGRKAKD